MIVGAGVIGLEARLGVARLGAEVTVVEFLDRILPGMDGEVAKQFQRFWKSRALRSSSAPRSPASTRQAKACRRKSSRPRAASRKRWKPNVVLVAIGRVPYTEGLGLKEAGRPAIGQSRPRADRRAFLPSLKGVYAIGDVIAGPMLAQRPRTKAVCARNCSRPRRTACELRRHSGRRVSTPGSVGGRSKELRARRSLYVGKSPHRQPAVSRSNQTTDGFVEGSRGCENRSVLGVHIVGREAGGNDPRSGGLMEFGGSAEDLARTCHAHPIVFFGSQ